MGKKGEYMSKRRRNNVSYLNKSKKRRKLNPRKIMILIIVLGIFGFGITKMSKGIYSFLSNIGKNPQATSEHIDTSKQFDLNDEKSDLTKKYTVLVDAGHGGNDGGTESSKNTPNGRNNVYEKDVALEISKKVVSKLSQYNDIEVLVTRTDDTYISLLDRMEFANSQNVDVSVSIHLNAESGGNTATGVETYFRRGATDGSKELAEIVQSSIISYVGARDRGVREENYDMVKGVTMPAILIETGFLTNPDEERNLTNDKYQEKLAEGIVQGILSYLDSTGK